jgi:DNA-binding transcriptional ArsR family regulator
MAATDPPSADVRLEVSALAEALNEIDVLERELFGDAVNAVIVRHVKAATLRGSSVGIRGLGRVLGLEPATVRRRVARLVDAGLLERDEGRLRYSAYGLERGRELTRRVLLRLARVYRERGWGEIHPPTS